MNLLAMAMIFGSTFTHALWNMIAKQAKDKHIFFWLTKVAEVGLFIVPFLVMLRYYPVPVRSLIFVFGSGTVGFLYYIFLAKAYDGGDLSVAYPIARCALLFVPLLSFFFIGERLSGIGIIGIFVILAGVFLLHLEGTSLRTIKRNFLKWSTFFALLTAFCSAVYSLIDKVAVDYINPFMYFFLFNMLIGVYYSFFVMIKSDRASLVSEWAGNKRNIISVAILNILTYTVVLFAFQMSKVSYAVAVRQFSIVVGVFMGIRLLKEKHFMNRLVASLVIFIGIVLVGIAK
ncbi:hypothetical protein COV93_08950 [Candidatus Woesearchaeota archaeon CG11_big_fil_rev_8_21_14_0_20_43_8]|nr:MAG: hypothetical protein COV93_08950 [Candidatus Woesearchaeota archaeon CG11_big_fil_rev_8_21_14_0_20_43_8]